ncbi:MAG: hypothetical protein KDD99_21155, partial [Bacteroidetes bacterium]|nr:hypothetical protein [Bacteroidota bacterium]
FLNTNIHFHKRQYLISWEKDHSTSSEFVTEKVAELNEAKSDLKEIISLAQEEGYDISIDGVLEIKLTK